MIDILRDIGLFFAMWMCNILTGLYIATIGAPLDALYAVDKSRRARAAVAELQRAEQIRDTMNGL